MPPNSSNAELINALNALALSNTLTRARMTALEQTVTSLNVTITQLNRLISHQIQLGLISGSSSTEVSNPLSDDLQHTSYQPSPNYTPPQSPTYTLPGSPMLAGDPYPTIESSNLVIPDAPKKPKSKGMKKTTSAGSQSSRKKLFGLSLDSDEKPNPAKKS